MSEMVKAAGVSATSGGGDKKGTGIDKDNSFKLLPVLPVLLKTKVLTLEDCLKCRLVCGKWKQGVDSVLQNDPSRLNLPEESRAISLRVGAAVTPERERLFGDFGMNIWGSWFFVLSARRVNWTTDRGFVDQLLAHPRNPFVGRSLNLRTNHWMDYSDLGRRLLTRFGNELWYFCFRIDDTSSVKECPVEARISDALCHLQNLKWLELDVSLPQDEDEPILENRVRQYFSRYPLPKLQHLETFCCDGMFKTPAIILTSILESCAVPQNLKRLNVSNSQLKHNSSLLFPNLEEIGIKMDLKDVASLKDNSPHLKKISLVVINPAKDGTLQDIECVQLFGALEAFQGTLVELGIGRELQEGFSYSIRWNAGFRIHLPKLESLVLDFEIPPECLQNLGSLLHYGVLSFSEEEEQKSYKLEVERLVPSLKTFQCNGVLCKIQRKRKLSLADRKRSSKFGEWITWLMNAVRSYF